MKNNNYSASYINAFKRELKELFEKKSDIKGISDKEFRVLQKNYRT